MENSPFWFPPCLCRSIPNCRLYASFTPTPMPPAPRPMPPSPPCRPPRPPPAPPLPAMAPASAAPAPAPEEPRLWLTREGKSEASNGVVPWGCGGAAAVPSDAPGDVLSDGKPPCSPGGPTAAWSKDARPTPLPASTAFTMCWLWPPSCCCRPNPLRSPPWWWWCGSPCMYCARVRPTPDPFRGGCCCCAVPRGCCMNPPIAAGPRWKEYAAWPGSPPGGCRKLAAPRLCACCACCCASICYSS
mmetsp:Transcript_6493/g.22341  ORF Transcript_6493/g.22341 Transcript_6493/m.22341 type:complete len:244 (-) Transcript_6493:301-1032(-)